VGVLYRVEPRIARRGRVIELGLSDGGVPEEWVQLGRLAEDGPRKDVRLDLTHEHVLAIVGKRGSGKSFTLGSVLEGLCTRDTETSINHISKERAVLLFDTLNIFQWMTARVDPESAPSRHIREQARLLRAWRLEPVELDVDLWVPAGWEERTAADATPFNIRTQDMAVADWAALIGVDAVNDILGQLLFQVHEKVTRRGYVGENGRGVDANPDYAIEDLLDCLERDNDILHDYARETRRALRQRLSAYEALPLFSTEGTTLTELLRPGRLTVMLLSGVPDDVRLTIVFLLIRKLLGARGEASEAAKALELGASTGVNDGSGVRTVVDAAPPKTWVVIDEAQNIFPSEKQTTASATLLRFVREGRNFGLSLAFTTQQPSAIDSRIMAQVDNLIVHTLTVDKDLKNVLANLKSRPPARIQIRRTEVGLADAIRELDVGQAFVTDTDAERGMFIDVRPRTSVHGGFEG
jgi:DNA helicase HerA-like ATPase